MKTIALLLAIAGTARAGQDCESCADLERAAATSRAAAAADGSAAYSLASLPTDRTAPSAAAVDVDPGAPGPSSAAAPQVRPPVGARETVPLPSPQAAEAPAEKPHNWLLTLGGAGLGALSGFVMGGPLGALAGAAAGGAAGYIGQGNLLAGGGILAGATLGGFLLGGPLGLLAGALIGGVAGWGLSKLFGTTGW